MEWNFTSSKRAVLSARSTKVPRRTKCSASSLSMVPSDTPRHRWERYLTHSKNCAGSFFQASLPKWRCSASQTITNDPRTMQAEPTALRSTLRAMVSSAEANAVSRSSPVLTMAGYPSTRRQAYSRSVPSTAATAS
ncbi:hypothetical protein SDC9_164623 [bioreactor metagenome]|uniref:Uncharacterized protein n=1 Tax=bioreactor metagenome TaxID=1076179 RepID=A0A645FTM2_9ZZZZ